MSTERLIPGHPNIQELGFVNPFIFITVEESKGDIPVHPNEQASVGRTNGSNELITYVLFNVPPISNFPGATADTKCFLVPLPASIDQSGSKSVEVFSLEPGYTLPTTLTFNTRPNPNLQLSTITFGGTTGLVPVEMDIGGQTPCNFGQKQVFQIRCTGDNALLTFNVNPVDTYPNGMALVVGNVS